MATNLDQPTAIGRIAVIVPTHNRFELAKPSLLALCHGIALDGNSELIVVDQGSVDGVREFAAQLPDVKVIPSRARTAGELRNEGVQASESEWVCFVDSDVVVPADYFPVLRAALQRFPESIVGRAYALPPQPHWVERSWDDLNARPGDGVRAYLNAGNIALSRRLFLKLGGFDPRLSSGEDTDLARRARALGVMCEQVDALQAVHLGNPKSIASFFRKQKWHGEGARLTDLVARAAIATVVLYFFGALTAGILLVRGTSIAIVALMFAGIVNFIPVLAYAHRAYSRGRISEPIASIVLLHVYFVARFIALALRRGRHL